MTLALAMLCGGVILVTLAVLDKGYRTYCAWIYAQAKMRRDLSVTQRLLTERTLEVAMLKASINLRSTALSVRKRPRGLYVVGSKP